MLCFCDNIDIIWAYVNILSLQNDKKQTWFLSCLTKFGCDDNY